MKVIGVIPARYHSSRLEGKPLVDILGKPMIQRVYEQASKALEHVVVATDDDRIFSAVENFGGEAVMTSEYHKTGTNRVWEAYQKLKIQADIIINIQGDEPMLEPEQLEELISVFKNNKHNVEFATLIGEVSDVEPSADSSSVFVVVDQFFRALYFSRSLIPYYSKTTDVKNQHYYEHVGLYAYTPKALKDFCALPPSSLERAENLEQNRWLEQGRKIYTTMTSFSTYPVDTTKDLKKIIAILSKRQKMN